MKINLLRTTEVKSTLAFDLDKHFSNLKRQLNESGFASEIGALQNDLANAKAFRLFLSSNTVDVSRFYYLLSQGEIDIPLYPSTDDEYGEESYRIYSDD